MAFDVASIRKQFPILERKVYGKPLVYLDNAASSQKPKRVVDLLSGYYLNEHSNIHRGVHFLSQHATEKYEQVREDVRKFINAAHAHEIIFTRGTTEAINLVAYSFGKAFLKPGDEVLVSAMEHHSNIVPWQLACEERGALVKAVPINDAGELEMDAFRTMLNGRVKIVAITHVSNTLGTINPVKEIVRLAHDAGATVLLDGAQAVPHMAVDVRDLDADFYTFSSHKMYGPTGFGVLYGKESLLDKMPPWQGGGDMIESVTFEKTTYNDLPHKFEAGTPNIADGIAFQGALDFIRETGYDNIARHEEGLLHHATEKLSEIDGIRFIGTATQKAGVVSFLVGETHPYDLGALLDQMGIAVRTGHHCTEPLMLCYDIPGTVRASFAVYNTFEEVDALINGVKKAVSMLA